MLKDFVLKELDCFADARNDASDSALATLGVRALPTTTHQKVDLPPAEKRERSAERRIQPMSAHGADKWTQSAPLIVLRGSAHFRGALAFRRSAAALARANASAVGSAPVPAFPETRLDGRYPLSPVTSLPSSSETGRHAGRAVAQSRPAPRLHPQL